MRCESVSKIHPTAIVDGSAELADDVTVGAYSLIGPGVSVGAGSEIGPHVVLEGPTSLGKNNTIFQFASVGAAPQDKKYAGEPTRLEIGDGNTIREFVTINRGTAQDAAVTRLGDDNWVMAYVHVAHDCQIGSHTILANNVTLAGHVHVGDHAILGGFSGVHQFCRIGMHAFIGMYSAINQDVPAFVMTGDQPARARGVNSEGLKRRGYTREQIRSIRRAFKLVYRSGATLNDALAELKSELPERPELSDFIDSIEVSERGLLR